MNEITNSNVIGAYYSKILHFKSAKSFVADMNAIATALDQFHTQTIVQVLKKLVFKYKHSVNEVGKLLTGIVTLGDTRVYKQKTKEDLYFDGIYMMRIIILAAAVHVGLVANLKEAVLQMKKAGYDMKSLNGNETQEN